MAGTYKRAGAASWGAIWKDERGHNLRKSTFVNISQPGKKEAQTRREAQAVADAYEAVHRGRILYTKQAELFRAAAGPSFDEQRALNKRLDVLRELGTAGGTARRMPTVREYLEEFRPTGGARNISNAKRCFDLFLDFLGRGGRHAA